MRPAPPRPMYSATVVGTWQRGQISPSVPAEEGSASSPVTPIPPMTNSRYKQVGRQRQRRQGHQIVAFSQSAVNGGHVSLRDLAPLLETG
jgi:hypothetical protein